jgi:hypothetical protein
MYRRHTHKNKIAFVFANKLDLYFTRLSTFYCLFSFLLFLKMFFEPLYESYVLLICIYYNGSKYCEPQDKNSYKSFTNILLLKWIFSLCKRKKIIIRRSRRNKVLQTCKDRVSPRCGGRCVPDICPSVEEIGHQVQRFATEPDLFSLSPSHY